MSEKSNVIEFKKRAPSDDSATLVIKKPKNYQGCKHNFFEVDEILRTVECTDCKVELDPIWCLLQLAARYVERDWKWKKIEEFQRKEKEREEKRLQKLKIKYQK